MRILSRKELIQIAYRPQNDIPEQTMNRIIKRLLLIDEQDFIVEIQKALPCIVNPVITNRYYLS
jgi:hypothetical protein